jgi:succinate dehydrogenase/fumarate reductase flavoprotein subunit
MPWPGLNSACVKSEEAAVVEVDDSWGDEWDRVADVVVVGTGVAGLAAAIAAADAGASVIVLERQPIVGGTTAKSSGAMWIPNNRYMREAGLIDDRETALRYLARLAHPMRYAPDEPNLGLPVERFRLLETFFDGAASVVDHLTSLGALDVALLDSPDYFAALPEDTVPVGRLLFPTFPPDWPAGATGGQLLVERMHKTALALGAAVLVEHRAVHVVRNRDQEVIGVEVQVGRRTELVGARQGVVFCSGGFLHNPKLTYEFLRGPVLGGPAAAGSTGDFVNIGIEVGAQLGNMSHAWWMQVVVDLVARVPETIRGVTYCYGDSMLVVNRFGRRVVNEKIPYNERTQVHFEWDPVGGEYKNLILIMIWDDAVARQPTPNPHLRYPIPLPGDNYDFVITADTWKELVSALETRLAGFRGITAGFSLDAGFADGLADTIARFNKMAITGIDEDFHRGETPVEQAWAGPPRSGLPSGSMHPFREHGPYHAVLLGPGALDTKGGPVIDDRARVLRLDGSPVPGLYGGGNCVASPAGQAYWGPGGTIGPAIVFGYLAGSSAAEDQRRQPDPLP